MKLKKIFGHKNALQRDFFVVIYKFWCIRYYIFSLTSRLINFKESSLELWREELDFFQGEKKFDFFFRAWNNRRSFY